MAVSSNRRQRILEYATPKVADLVVIELVDEIMKEIKENTRFGGNL